MSMLTDSEQLKLLDELSQTARRIRAAMKEVLKECRITEIPGEVQAAREENRKLHARTSGKIGTFAKALKNMWRHGESELDRVIQSE